MVSDGHHCAAPPPSERQLGKIAAAAPRVET
jgi:hypothetical protein